MPLPRIACFHGGGSNSLVFAYQCKRLQQLLAHEYEFVFFDAPFEREAGPGVLPHFKELAPFRTWMKPEFLQDDESEVLEKVIQLMADDTRRRQKMAGEHVREGQERQVGKWVGAMGFSQGTRVVGGLLRWMQSATHSSHPDIDIQFGILCMGSAKPMSCNASSTRSSSNCSSASSSVHELQDPDTGALEFDTIRIPTLHLHGLRDAILPRSREQLTLYYDAECSRLLEINYHHAMPWYTHDLTTFVTLFRETHERGRNIAEA
ncbi:hypothetical protein G6514_005515 [Epicoccum nigrum]|nr:hypothetical protein G6514_005515 [Epicoccum nigrum]